VAARRKETGVLWLEQQAKNVEKWGSVTWRPNVDGDKTRNLASGDKAPSKYEAILTSLPN
jgi:hypothetical protein